MIQLSLDFGEAANPQEEICPGAKTIGPGHAWVYLRRDAERCLKCGEVRQIEALRQRVSVSER